MVKIDSNSLQKHKNLLLNNDKPEQKKDLYVGLWGGISLFVQVSLLHLFHSKLIFPPLEIFTFTVCTYTRAPTSVFTNSSDVYKTCTIISSQSSLTIFFLTGIHHCSSKPQQILHCTVTQKISAPSL